MREISGFRVNSASLGPSPQSARTLFSRPDQTTPESTRPPPSFRPIQPGRTSFTNNNGGGASTSSPGYGAKKASPLSPGGGSFSGVGVSPSGDSITAFNSVIQFWKEAENRASQEDFNRLKVELDSAKQQAQASSRTGSMFIPRSPLLIRAAQLCSGQGAHSSGAPAPFLAPWVAPGNLTPGCVRYLPKRSGRSMMCGRSTSPRSLSARLCRSCSRHWRTTCQSRRGRRNRASYPPRPSHSWPGTAHRPLPMLRNPFLTCGQTAVSQRKANMAALKAVDDTNTERDTLRSEAKQMKAALDAATKDAAASKAALQKLQSESANSADDASKLRARVSQLESELRDRDSKDRIEARGGARPAPREREAHSPLRTSWRAGFFAFSVCSAQCFSPTTPACRAHVSPAERARRGEAAGRR